MSYPQLTAILDVVAIDFVVLKYLSYESFCGKSTLLACNICISRIVLDHLSTVASTVPFTGFGIKIPANLGLPQNDYLVSYNYSYISEGGMVT